MGCVNAHSTVKAYLIKIMYRLTLGSVALFDHTQSAKLKGIGNMTSTVFLNRTYDEALELVIQARDYMAYKENQDRVGLNMYECMRASCETMRVTSRLTHIMSWLMMQKAVFNGEVSIEEALYMADPLSEEDVCLLREHKNYSFLSRRLHEILDQSLALYMRVCRLESSAIAQLEAAGSEGGTKGSNAIPPQTIRPVH